MELFLSLYALIVGKNLWQNLNEQIEVKEYIKKGDREYEEKDFNYGYL